MFFESLTVSGGITLGFADFSVEAKFRRSEQKRAEALAHQCAATDKALKPKRTTERDAVEKSGVKNPDLARPKTSPREATPTNTPRDPQSPAQERVKQLGAQLERYRQLRSRERDLSAEQPGPPGAVRPAERRPEQASGRGTDAQFDNALKALKARRQAAPEQTTGRESGTGTERTTARSIFRDFGR